MKGEHFSVVDVGKKYLIIIIFHFTDSKIQICQKTVTRRLSVCHCVAPTCSSGLNRSQRFSKLSPHVTQPARLQKRILPGANHRNETFPLFFPICGLLSPSENSYCCCFLLCHSTSVASRWLRCVLHSASCARLPACYRYTSVHTQIETRPPNVFFSFPQTFRHTAHFPNHGPSPPPPVQQSAVPAPLPFFSIKF